MSSTPAYVITPASGSGPGVLVLHSWFGLTTGVKEFCNALADAGFVALAPDLLDGETTLDPEVGQRLLAEKDPNELAISVNSTSSALRSMPATIDAPIAVVGFSMGASLGLWLSEREPDLVSTVVSYYGSQGIDFTRTTAAYQFHLAATDHLVDPDELALMEASLHLAGRTVDVHTYDDTGHWFAEEGTLGYVEDAARHAFERTIEFLRTHTG